MTSYSFEYLNGGRNASFKPWRDHENPQFVYHLRESNFNNVVPEGFQLVKINVITGEVVAGGPLWENDDDYGDLGACYVDPTAIHAAGVNLTSSSGTSKLYLFGSSGFGSGPYDHVVIEFSKTSLDVTNHWVVGPVGSDSNSRDRGVAVTSLDGVHLACAGNSDANAIPNPDTFSTSYIDLFRTTDGTYNRVELNGDCGITDYLGLYYYYHAPICFDHLGFLWFITAPWAAGTGGRPNRSTGTSTLYKCAIDESLNLTVVDSFPIDDDFYSYDAGMGVSLAFSESVGYARLVCNPTTKKLNMWVDWRTTPANDASEGWFFEFDLQTEEFSRGPIDWTSGEFHDVAQKIDSIGFSTEDYMVVWRQNPPGFTSSVLVIFQLSTGTERLIALDENFEFASDLGDATFFHNRVDDADDYIYAMDVDFITDGDGFQIYRDALFIIANPDGGGGPPVVISPTDRGSDVNIEGL